MRQITHVPGDEVVHADDLVAFGKEAIAKMGSEKTGGSGNNGHGGSWAHRGRTWRGMDKGVFSEGFGQRFNRQIQSGVTNVTVMKAPIPQLGSLVLVSTIKNNFAS